MSQKNAIGALFILTLLLPQLIGQAKGQANVSPEPRNPSLTNTAADNAREPTTLEPGKTVERELSGAQKHGYRIHFTEGQYALVTVEQRGIDVVVRCLGPDGKLIAEFDSEIRLRGQETAELVAEESGTYTLSVEARQGNASAGGYAILLAEVRSATDRDRSLLKARGMHATAITSRRAGKYDEALAQAESALDIREKILGSDNAAVAVSLTLLANIYGDKGDRVKAKPLYQRALVTFEKALGSDHPNVATLLSNLANTSRDGGAYNEAELLNKQALEIREKAFGSEHPDVAASLHSLAEVYRLKGDYTQAESFCQRALVIREKHLGPEHLDVASTLNILGILYRQKGDLIKAEQAYQRVIQIREKVQGPEHPNVGAALNNLANLYSQAGNLAKAEPLYRRSLEIKEKALGPEHPQLASTIANLGNFYRDSRDYDKAEQMYERALQIWSKTLGPEHSDYAQLLNELAILYAAKGDFVRAVRTQARANAITERNFALTLAAGSGRQKMAYLDSLTPSTDRSISLHTMSAPGNPEARDLAATIVLQRKGRVLDAMADTLNALRRRSAPQDHGLLDRLNVANAQLAKLVLSGPQEMALDDYQNQLRTLEQQRERLESELSVRTAGFYQHTEQPITIAKVQSAIPENAALIEFLVYRPANPKAANTRNAFGDPRYVAYVLRHEGEVHWKDLGKVQEIDQAVELLRQSLRDPKRRDVARFAREVDEILMQPIRPLLGDATRVLISPDGMLNLIPFEALVDKQDHYLVEQYSITYLTSGRDLVRLRVPRQSMSSPILIADPSFGEPEMSEIAKATGIKRKEAGRTVKRQSVTTATDMSSVYFAPLDGTAQEARAIKAQFSEATLLTGTKATEGSLKDVVAPRILHIATHGFFLEQGLMATPDSAVAGTRAINANVQIENPLLRSGLALAGANLRRANGDDGVLTALETAGLNLWGTRLVTLSACDTGLGEVWNGEGVYGLRRAMILAGAETLVMSLWPVSDQVTREMMTGYYDGLKREMGRGEALRQVQLKMLKRKELQHPFYWASFIQLGEWANLNGRR